MTKKQPQEMLDWMASKEQTHTINLRGVEFKLRVMSFTNFFAQLTNEDSDSKTNTKQSKARQSKNKLRLWRARQRKAESRKSELSDLFKLATTLKNEESLGDKIEVILEMIPKMRSFLESALPILLITHTWLAKPEALDQLRDTELVELFIACFNAFSSSQN